MKLLYHIYEHKSGRKFLLRCVPATSEDSKSKIVWYGFEVNEYQDGIMYAVGSSRITDLISEGRFWKGSLKKEVLRKIQNEINDEN